MGLLVVVLVAALGASLWSDRQSETRAAGDVDLPADDPADASATSDDASGGDTRGAAGTRDAGGDAGTGRADATGGVEDADASFFECLTDDGCGWRTDINDLAYELDAGRIDAAGERRLVVVGNEAVVAIDPRDGQRRWSQRIVDGGGDVGGVVASEEVVLVAPHERTIAFDTATGARRWSASAPTRSTLSAGGALTEDGSSVVTVFTPTHAGRHMTTPSIVRAYDAANGRILWEHRARQVVLGRSTVILVDEDLRAVDPASGEITWTVERWLPEGTTLEDALHASALIVPGHGPLVVDTSDGVMVYDIATGRLVTRRDGHLIWVARDDADVDVDGPAFVVHDPDDQSLTAIGADGRAAWKRSTADARCCLPTMGGQALVLDAADERQMVTLDVVDGSVWRAPDVGGGDQVVLPLAPHVALIHPHVALIDDDPDLRPTVTAVDLRDDTRLWRFRGEFVPRILLDHLLLVVDGELLGVPLASR